MQILSIQIPNLLQNPYITQMVQLNNQLYFFQFFWNIRQERAYLSIYKKQNEELVYLIKNICLIPNIELSKKIHDTEWQGRLYFQTVLSGQEADYRQDNIDTEFTLNYVTD